MGEPALIYFHDAQALEFTLEDCATVYDEVVPGFAIVRHMTTREPIGFRLFVSVERLRSLLAPPDAEPSP